MTSVIFGHRVRTVEEAKGALTDFVQVSIYNGNALASTTSIEDVAEIVQVLKDTGTRYVLHPIHFPLANVEGPKRQKVLEHLKEIAAFADPEIGLILHDEVCPDGGPLRGKYLHAYTLGLSEIAAVAPISIANAADSKRITDFWAKHGPKAASYTIDLAHLAQHGVNPLTFVKNLAPEHLDKVAFLHVHRNGAPHRDGHTDHWPLTPECPELAAFRFLAEGAPDDLMVIVECDGAENIERSLELLTV
ncbi:MAG: hypothetical protein ACT4PT_02530 [Methanobacteriota archaeon]